MTAHQHKRKSNRGVCHYHLCRKRTEIHKCKYCGESFCKEHLKAKPPGLPRFEGTSHQGRLFMEEWQNPGGHPCMPFLSHWEAENERKEKEYSQALDRLIKSKPIQFEKEEKLYEPEYEQPISEKRPRYHPQYFFESDNFSTKFIKRVSNRIPSLSKCMEYLVILVFVLGFILPIFLFFIHLDMQYVIGNPKPLYLYDIGSSCSNETNIISSLNHLSEETGVKFVRLQSPLALLSGGISYSCASVISDSGAVGEAESGFIGVSWFIIAWNHIRLSSVSQEVILHETLHVMGFGHSENPTSIMYPYVNQQGLENELKDFIRNWYARNPVAYFNIVPLNLLWMLFFIAIIFLYKK
ncbi:MAG: matrixin family metalloprotease [Candidatus Aenigmarchaeota archaeon]|nr:matrixin family metalloprotease [Candidatus Aenigmarchaeota archaeon]